ncbi:MAG: hypothetical protein ACLUIQ_11965 [Dialister invisus]
MAGSSCDGSIPAESVRLEEAENTAELLSGETGGTVSAGSGIEENTAAGNKGKDLSSLLPSVSYRHRVLMLFGRRPVFFMACRSCAPYGW